jgi:ATP-dependent Lon protease
MVENELPKINNKEPDSLNEIKTLPLLPLKNVVILPKSITPVIVGRNSSILAVEDSLRNSEELFITAQKHSEIEHPDLQDIFMYGTRAKILQVMRMHKGSLKILIEGIVRSKIIKRIENPEFILVECHDIKTTGLDNHKELEAAWRQLSNLYTKYSQLNTKAPSDLISQVKSYEDMDSISDTIAVQINLSFNERQQILELSNLIERIIKLCALLHKEIDILETEERIKGNIQKQVEKNQREYYLNEQIKAIHKELGREDSHAEIMQLRNKIKTLGLPEEPMEKVDKELKRLEQMPPMSSEAVVSRHYIDWIISIPWQKESKDNVSLQEAEKILDSNHSGLKKVKDRIIEFLAAKKFSKKLSKSPILCLIGPPGVGKTSLAKSIADSLGREFVRISLGGVKDEAEIRGHRRTYIGALPGKIIQAMRKAKTLNPVILLDEIDKISSDFHGDPAAALLEVLDPEQNKSFVDHFLEIEYDLSKVMFIATANHIDGIPYPLFDRMEKITLSGYTEQEKVSIAKNFLIPKNLEEYGLKPEQFQIDDDIIKKIINQYTKEAGVRQLERIIAKLMRKTIQVILKSEIKKRGVKSVNNIIIDENLLKEWLGNPIFKKTDLNRNNKIGIATGLAWTEFGGDVLEIEVSILPGKGTMTLTGQLGDVMQESAHAALSYIRARAKKIGLKESFYSSKDIHINVPEGATPKDGPSAGITICTALVSALTNNPIKPSIAMTGEITLSGRVLAIGAPLSERGGD